MSRQKGTILGLQKNLTFEKNFTCHQTFQYLKLSYKTFRGYDHSLYTIEQLKDVLSNFDSKLHVHCCNIHTSFYGSNLIDEIGSYCYLCKKGAIHYPFKNDRYC